MTAKLLFTFKHFKFPLLPLLTHSALGGNLRPKRKLFSSLKSTQTFSDELKSLLFGKTFRSKSILFVTQKYLHLYRMVSLSLEQKLAFGRKYLKVLFVWQNLRLKQ